MNPPGRGGHPAVFILGMHRSGTSFVAGLARRAGLAPLRGEPVGALPSNPFGHEEVAELVLRNERLLNRMGGAWHTVPTLDPPLPWSLAAPGDPRARADIEAAWTDEPWFWKDPRLCLTFPHWARLLGERIRPAAVIVYRHPLEVARSLERRNGFPVPLGLALWEAHYRHALPAVRGLPVVVRSYEDALADPVSTRDAFTKLMGAVGADAAGPEVDDDLADWAHTDARHHRADDDRALHVLSDEQRALLDLLESSRGPHDSWVPTPTTPATPWAVALMHQRLETRAMALEVKRLEARALKRRAKETAKKAYRATIGRVTGR